MQLGLKEKNAFVTGGSHGIGKAIALALADEGCNVAVCARGSENLGQIVAELKSKNIKVLGIQGDVTSQNAANNMLEAIIETWGTLHILANNIGGGGCWGSEIPEETEERVWDEVYERNALTAAHFTMKVLPFMLKQNWGRIVTISSIHGYEGGGRPWFNMAKSAEISLMKSLSLMPRYATKNITFNSVAPGYIMIPDTGWEKIKDEKFREYDKALAELPRGHFGTPEEVANLVTFLCSEKASLINGQTIRADGGQTKSF